MRNSYSVRKDALCKQQLDIWATPGNMHDNAMLKQGQHIMGELTRLCGSEKLAMQYLRDYRTEKERSK